MEPGHLLHSALTRPSSADARRLKLRHPFVPAASVPSKPEKTALSAPFWMSADNNFENRHLHFWTQFASLEKISQNTI